MQRLETMPGSGRLLISLVNETAREAYSAYGVVNSTALSTSNQGRALFEDANRNVFVELVSCDTDACSFRAASVLVRLTWVSSFPESIEVLTTLKISAGFSDARGRPFSNLAVTLLVDDKSIPLVTDENGETRYQAIFDTLGQHTVSFKVAGILWPETPKWNIQVQFPTMLLIWTTIPVASLVALLWLWKRRRPRHVKPVGLGQLVQSSTTPARSSTTCA
jgi:hypothetical protein